MTTTIPAPGATAPLPISGTQYRIEADGYVAEIAGVGASLRTLAHEGRELVLGFAQDEVRPGFRGAVLAPWPNRVVDGQFVFRSQQHILALSEPARGHALHGLAAWVEWEAEDVTPTSVTLVHAIPAQEGYPYQVRVRVTYAVGPDGLAWSVAATNEGTTTAPYGTAPHPYLVAGDGLADDWTLELPAAQVQTVTPDRLIPTGIVDVATYDGGVFDFRAPRLLGQTFLDHAFTALTPGADDLVRAALRAADGSGVGMSWSTDCPWVQVHTPQAPGPDGWRRGVAVEPMTCPPGAFNSGTDVVALEPGRTHEVRWGIYAL